MALGLAMAGCGGPDTQPQPLPPTVGVTDAACPAAPVRTPVSTGLLDLDRELVPLEADHLHLCAYGPTNVTDAVHVALMGQADFSDRAAVEPLRSALNELPRLQKGAYNCPADRGLVVVLTFSRAATGQAVEVAENATGCGGFSNGHFSTATSAEAERLLRPMLPAAYVALIPH